MKLSYEDEQILRDLIFEKKRERATREWRSMELQHKHGYIDDEKYRMWCLGEIGSPTIQIVDPSSIYRYR